jgi:putative acetyltransferase
VGSQFSGTGPRSERRRLTGTFLHTSGRHLLLIRAEKESDISAVRSLNEAAFQRSAEADLVDALRRQARPIVSLVAERETIVVGHILFSPVSLEGGPDLKIMGLAPMAVASRHQRSGIGSALVRAGLEQCKKLGVSAVAVLGHPEYYPRFGFLPSTRFDIRSEYNVAEEAFMVVELEPGALRGRSGRIKYHPAFSQV